MMKKELEVHELLKAAQAGDQEAVLLLCERFIGLVRKLSYRYAFVVDDAEQEAWLAFWSAVRDYREDKGAMFPWYVQQKIRFTLVNLGKKNKFFNNTEELSEMLRCESVMEDEVQSNLLWEKAQSELSEREWEVFRRVVAGDESKADIAAEMLITRQSVHNIFNKAVQKLKKSFGGCDYML